MTRWSDGFLSPMLTTSLFDDRSSRQSPDTDGEVWTTDRRQTTSREYLYSLARKEKSSAMCKTGFKPLHCLLSLITVIVCVFDVATNWYTFADYIKHRTRAQADQVATVALGCASSAGTLILFLALLNLMRALEAYTSSDPEKKQESVGRWQEVALFLQIVVEDSAVALILYGTFREASCPLYRQVFIRSRTADVALVGALSGSVWKTASGLINCVCGCVTEAETGCGWAMVCCLCRLAVNIIAAALMAFVTYQLVNYNRAGFELRLDCSNQPPTATI